MTNGNTSQHEDASQTGASGSVGGVSRRRLLASLGAGALVGTAGCTFSPREDLEIAKPGTEESSITGVVRSVADESIDDATVTALREGGDPVASASVNGRGEFSLDCDEPAWIRVKSRDHLSRTVAASPEERTTVRLTPDNDGVSLLFGGDTMFGRRFYDEKTDPIGSQFTIDRGRRLESHRELLSYVRPLLESADVTSMNLETALTTSDWIHPTKKFKYTSHPVAAKALGEAGVEYVSLGNNHVFDALKPGFDETVRSLDAEGIRHSGAGLSASDAWKPAYIERNGLTVAYISCCTVVGEGLQINWSSSRDVNKRYTLRRGGAALTFSGDIGVAEPTVKRLRTHVSRAASKADVVVVQIHGGDEYVRRPTKRIRRLTEAASAAGADIVANHHPHVTGGVEFSNSTLIAWSLGNAVFDQQLWPTLQSYMLSVDVDSSGVRRASVEPVVLDEYVTKGATGAPKRTILSETAERSSKRFSLTNSSLGAIPDRSPSRRSVTRRIEGNNSIFQRNSGWVSDIGTVQGTVRLGRDRIANGQFENAAVDDRRSGGALWRYGRGSTPTIRRNGGLDQSGGAKLSRHTENVDEDVITPVHRLPIGRRDLTLSLAYRSFEPAEASVLVAWYGDAQGESFASGRYDLPTTGGGWERFEKHLEAPSKATYANFFIFLYPPDSHDISELQVDDVRLIEWASQNVTGGQQFDHLFVEGSSEVSFTSEDTDTEIRWTETQS